MKKLLMGVFAICLTVVAGCATMPDPVSTTFLSEIKSDESEKIRSLEQAVLEKKEAKDAADKEHATVLQESRVSDAVLAYLNKKKTVYSEKDKLFVLKKDEQGAVKNASASKRNDILISNQRKYNEYILALRDERKAVAEVKEADMSVAIWEMQYEKSQVARNYQDKRPEEFDEKKSGLARFFQGKTKIEPGEYEQHLARQNKILEKKRELHVKALEELKKTEQHRDLSYTVE